MRYPTNNWSKLRYPGLDAVKNGTKTVSLIIFICGCFAAPAQSQKSFWTTTVPNTPEVTNDTASVTLGLKFYSDIPGTVTAVRFYKGPHNTGTHTGNLWLGSGIKLATATFSGETASGWQQANFASPVSITANTVYVVSYLAPQGAYADEQNYSWSSLSAAPLHVSGSAPGVFAYGSSVNFPGSAWNSSNYFVDLVFVPSTGGSTPAATYSISGKVTGSAATLALSGATSKSTTTDSSGNYSFSGLANGSYQVSASQAGYAFTPATAAVSISGANSSPVNFTATKAVSLWSNATTPATASDPDSSSVQLGLTFYSDVAGSVTAVRFYKGSGNTGTHVGQLWTSTGTSLANATFTGETSTGWQQANFASPVHIAANTNYVISYLAPNGYYADDQYYSWSTLSAAPLHVSGASPGVFAYGSTNAFPKGVWNSSNYFVDLVFVPDSVSSGSGTSNPPTTYSISGTVNGSAATLTLSGASSASTTTQSGSYSFSGLANGTYLVTPSQTGYTFVPSSTLVTISGAAVSATNFLAVATAPAGGGGSSGSSGGTSGASHSVVLTWDASVSTNISGYKVYRGAVSGGPYILLSTSLVTGTSFTDTSVSAGQTYYYCMTAVDTNNVESGYSNQAMAVVPTP